MAVSENSITHSKWDAVFTYVNKNWNKYRQAVNNNKFLNLSEVIRQDIIDVFNTDIPNSALYDLVDIIWYSRWRTV